jgi:hypothetical protein
MGRRWTSTTILPLCSFDSMQWCAFTVGPVNAPEKHCSNCVINGALVGAIKDLEMAPKIRFWRVLAR